MLVRARCCAGAKVGTTRALRGHSAIDGMVIAGRDSND